MLMCGNCRKDNPDGTKFCNVCGMPLVGHAPGAVPVMQPAAESFWTQPDAGGLQGQPAAGAGEAQQEQTVAGTGGLPQGPVMTGAQVPPQGQTESRKKLTVPLLAGGALVLVALTAGLTLLLGGMLRKDTKPADDPKTKQAETTREDSTKPATTAASDAKTGRSKSDPFAQIEKGVPFPASVETHSLTGFLPVNTPEALEWYEREEYDAVTISYDRIVTDDMPDALRDTIDEFNEARRDTLYQSLLEGANKWYDELILHPGNEVVYMVFHTVEIGRADSRVFSFYEELNAGSSVAYTNWEGYGYTYDAKTGEQLTLSDVITDRTALYDAVYEELLQDRTVQESVREMESLYGESYREIIGRSLTTSYPWMLNTEGIVVMNPFLPLDDDTGFARVVVSAAEYPELFAPLYVGSADPADDVPGRVKKKDAKEERLDLAAYCEEEGGFQLTGFPEDEEETGEDPADEESPYCGDWYAEDGSIYLELGESAALMNSESDRRTGMFWLESEEEFLYGEYMENKDGSLKLICWDIPGTMEKDLVYRVEIQKDNTGEMVLVLEGTPLYRE